MAPHFAEELYRFGVTDAEIKPLAREAPELIDYLDLIERRPRRMGPEFVRPDAVIEVDGNAILYIVRADSLAIDPATSTQALVALRTVLACRGDAGYVGVLRSGELTLYPICYSADLRDAVVVSGDSPRAPLLLSDLAMGLLPTSGSAQSPPSESDQQRADRRAVRELLFRLLGRVTKELRKAPALEANDGAVLSLVGRALFSRFLVDRGILNEQVIPSLLTSGGIDACFASPANAADICAWLDSTFNGELLPLPVGSKQYRSYFTSLAESDNTVFNALSKIIQRTSPDGQLLLDWGWIDFAHVPVGLLSEVYEEYAHAFFRPQAVKESVHYTPRHIAEYVVEQAFRGLPETQRAKAKVLDGAAGAGVFLVLAFRHLVKELWIAQKRRPNTAQIRAILRNNIRGFDINSHALNLAALSLHLTAVELDPDPVSAKSTKFEKLEGHTLIHVRGQGEQFPAYPVLGSLGPIVGREHNGEYDLVIGNPPWTAWKGPKSQEMNNNAEQVINAIARARVSESDHALEFEALKNPDRVPDLPFVWRSMQWAKKGGIIALALHGRLLFKRAKTGADARDALFRMLRITGILNGAALDQDIWPNMNQPFCLLFARNELPKPDDLFNFVTPERDGRLNRQGRMRFDPDRVQPIQFRVLEKRRHLLKCLFRGTALDVELVERIKELVKPSEENGSTPKALTLKDYWASKGLHHGVGYQVASKANSAAILKRMGCVDLADESVGYFIHQDSLPLFAHDKLHRVRNPAIYKAPLVVLNKALKEEGKAIRARLALGATPVAYSEAFVGYSAQGHPNEENLARYLFVIASSDLYRYYTLMTSAKFGVERRVIYGEDIEDFPIIVFESLTPGSLQSMCHIVATFEGNTAADLFALNNWVYDLYGLTDADRQLVHDTLDIQLPYSETERRAQSLATKKQRGQFCQHLKSMLDPFFALTEESLRIDLADPVSDLWEFLTIRTTSYQQTNSTGDTLRRVAVHLAEDAGASRIIVELDQGCLLVGILTQYRYWTLTQARLCSLKILRDHGAVFPVPSNYAH